MPIQARAGATRQRIVDAAAELFGQHGYGDTGMADIVARAQVTTGAFYYHFSSKEALAEVIIAQGWSLAWELASRCLGEPGAGLERVIVMTFDLSALMKQNTMVWVANNLNQSVGLLTEEGRREFEVKARNFVTGIAAALKPGEIRPEFSPEQIGDQVWMLLHGCHLLSDAFNDSVVDRLLHSWRIMLPAAVPAGSLARFEQVLETAATQCPVTRREPA